MSPTGEEEMGKSQRTLLPHPDFSGSDKVTHEPPKINVSPFEKKEVLVQLVLTLYSIILIF